MYHRFMPPHASFQPILDEQIPIQNDGPCPSQNPESFSRSSTKQKPPGSDPLRELTDGFRDSLSHIFKDFSLKNLDSGDILLLLIILFLFLEGDNWDLVIALGVMLLLGFASDPQPSA